MNNTNKMEGYSTEVKVEIFGREYTLRISTIPLRDGRCETMIFCDDLSIEYQTRNHTSDVKGMLEIHNMVLDALIREPPYTPRLLAEVTGIKLKMTAGMMRYPIGEITKVQEEA